MSIDQYAAPSFTEVADNLDEVFKGRLSEEVCLRRAGALGEAATHLLDGQSYRKFELLRSHLPPHITQTESGSTFQIAVMDSPETANGFVPRTSVVASMRQPAGNLKGVLTLGLPRSADQLGTTPPAHTKAFFALEGTTQHSPWYGSNREQDLLSYNTSMTRAATWIGFLLRRAVY